MEDWKAAHLSWIENNPRFVSKTYNGHEPYYNVMKYLYYDCPVVTQDYAKITFAQDLAWKKESQRLLIQLEKEFLTTTSHFVTIGFNHQTWCIQSVLKLIHTILSYEWISKAKCVFELHRSNGEHPHIHILFDSCLTKSKILEKLWAASGIKKIVLKKTFIDYKPALDIHYDYIMGVKQESKMKFVQMDRDWRDANNIDHLYVK